ncbi:MAG: hypothetical protein ACRCX8_15315 [Sarcina sp.]
MFILLILDAYKIQIFLIIAILILIRRTIYHKNNVGKILFWGIIIFVTLYTLAILLVTVGAAAIAPSFVQS